MQSAFNTATAITQFVVELMERNKAVNEFRNQFAIQTEPPTSLKYPQLILHKV